MRRPSRCRHAIRAAAVVAIAAGVSAPAAALALFSSMPTARTANVTAAVLAAPTGFTATATGTTTASLSWTAPSTLTGYTLSQSPGSLAGCSSTPSSATTSCTATGLSPATTYTWTLTADYNNWASSPVQASAETNFAATDLGNAVGTCSFILTGCTGPSVTTTNGLSELIFVYLKATSLGSTTISSITGPFTAAAQIASVQYPTASSGNYLFVWKATGNGSGPTAVQVTFSALTLAPTAWIDVVQLGSGEAPLACSGCTDSGTTTSGNHNAVAQLTIQHSADSEIAFLGTASASGTFTPPAGFSAIAGGGSSNYGTYANLTVQSSANFAMNGSSLTWGGIGVEVQP